MSILNKIIKVDYPEDQYYKEKTEKTQIVIHHTVSYRGVQGDINWWLSDDARVSTHIIIDWKGIPYQCYGTKSAWAHHLGVKVAVFQAQDIELIWKKRSNGKSYVANNEILNQKSIGVEIDALGPLTLKDGKYYDAYNGEFKDVDRIQVYDEPFRGYKYYEKYTDEQIQTLKELLLFWKDHWKIPLSYNIDMWDISKNALEGKSGVYSHNSYRSDKSDCHPQPELIKMLKGLTNTSFTKVKHV